MLFPTVKCDADQRKILDASQYLFLDKEEQVNFHFMIHQRNMLKTPDFMEDFETELLKRKFDTLRKHCPWFEELDYSKSFIPLPTYRPDEINRERFQQLLNDRQAPPIVIKGLVSDSSAVEKWNHDYLAKTFGEVEIMALQFAADGSYQAAGTDGSRNLTLSEIIQAQLSGTAKESYYVNNSAQIFNEFPELLDDIGGDKVLELFKGHSVNTFSQLFVGNVRTWGTNWHQGNDLSCALMINGVKRWYFIDPRLVYILRPYLNGPNGMMTKGEVRHSLDFQSIQNPLYAYMPKFVLDLEPGDALVFTKYWPHAVVNISPFQIMANMRMTEVDIENLKKGNSTANLLPVFDNILNSDPEFIKFKFEIYQGLGKRAKDIGDSEYFSGFFGNSQVIGAKRMKEYLINSGDFNIIVIPERKQYFLLGDDAQSQAIAECFVACEAVAYDKMQPLWFKYGGEESWKGFDGVERRINSDVSEADLIDYFVLKKFNFGSLVAVRDCTTRKVQVFKRDRLSGAAA